MDFRDQDLAPPFPWLGCSIESISALPAGLLIGCDVRMEAPIIGHRIRRAALAGGQMTFINPRRFDFRFPVAHHRVVRPSQMVGELAAVAKAMSSIAKTALPKSFADLTDGVEPGEAHRSIASILADAESPAVMMGNIALRHPALLELRHLAAWIARTKVRWKWTV